MRLRNYKETAPYTIEDTLLDVHPHSLDEPFHWCPKPGAPVWVKVPDTPGNLVRWRKGQINDEGDLVYTQLASLLLLKQGIFRSYIVKVTVKRQELKYTFIPGLQPELKPDSPEVRELLRSAGVFV
ncbi:hypothetical protein FA15DRAFT_691826 [Coprinopsis marcescibilis]|uniref:Uncharacterized protein n=1 Tax=Coprinopsis marcescibilis TaxID=230819 RepID=A0A5C3L6P2_COPMA|nr:hypothetical protein FA15DRAFT_691826 [Coprinopsis marcescibilis]